MAAFLTDNELNEMLRPARSAISCGSIWVHAKSGGRYIVRGVALSKGGQEPVVIYQAVRAGSIPWVRVARDFLDGRFIEKKEG